MPQVNLSTLNGRELRQLLDASRRRGDASLSYQILQEMAERRERPAERGPFMMLRPAERRHAAAETAEPVELELELSEPEEVDDLPPMPRWRPPAKATEPAAADQPQSEPAPVERRGRRKKAPAEAMTLAAGAPPLDAAETAPATVEIDPLPPLESHRPLSLAEPDPQPTPDGAAESEASGLRLHREPPETRREKRPRTRAEKPPKAEPTPRPERPSAPRPGRYRMAAGFAIGISVGVALGWWAGGGREALAPTAPPPVRTAALEPRAAPAPAPVTSSAAEPAPDAAPAAPVPSTDPPVAPIPSDNVQEAARDAEGKAIDPPPPAPLEARGAEPARPAETAQAAPERAARTTAPVTAPIPAKGCAAQPTPADREICGDPQLRRLQGELRRAYGKALEAHQDRALLRQRQLAWADARNAVTDRARLASLYQQRIQKLNAATAAARQAH